MRLITAEVQQKVTGEVSAKAYKRFVSKLRGMGKKELWEVIDHYLIHCINDENVDELIGILDDMKKSGQPVTASSIEDLLNTFSGPNQYNIADSSEEKPVSIQGARKGFVRELPKEDDLRLRRNQLDLLYDGTFFDSYLSPDLREQTARMLMTFAEAEKIPVQQLWTDIAEGVNAIVNDDETLFE